MAKNENDLSNLAAWALGDIREVMSLGVRIEVALMNGDAALAKTLLPKYTEASNAFQSNLRNAKAE